MNLQLGTKKHTARGDSVTLNNQLLYAFFSLRHFFSFDRRFVKTQVVTVEMGQIRLLDPNRNRGFAAIRGKNSKIEKHHPVVPVERILSVC